MTKIKYKVIEQPSFRERVIENEQVIFTRPEVCFMKECSTRELTHKARSQGDFTFTVYYIKDQQGYSYCGYCQRITADSIWGCPPNQPLISNPLVECPDCKRFFKGPRPYFPVNYECPECE